MNNGDNKKTEATTTKEADFSVTSVYDVKDENGNGIFHMRTKTKWVVALSTLLLFVTSGLIYATVEGGLGAEMWQVAVWGLCGLLSLYSIFRKSLAAMLFNLLLFFGVSLIPVWQAGYKHFLPVINNLSK